MSTVGHTTKFLPCGVECGERREPCSGAPTRLADNHHLTTLARTLSSFIPILSGLVIILNASGTTTRTPGGADCVAKACVDALCPTRYSGLIVTGFYSKVCRDLGIPLQG